MRKYKIPNNVHFRRIFLTTLLIISTLIAIQKCIKPSQASNQSQLEIMDTKKSGILVDTSKFKFDHSPLAIELGDVQLRSDIRGFAVVYTTDQDFILPDLSHQLEFRTSQLVIFNQRAFPSRKVLYATTSKAKVVVVCGVDATWDTDILEKIVSERELYCKENGYGLFIRYIQDFAFEGRPLKESLALSRLRLLRQAMYAFGNAEWFWYFGPKGKIQSNKTPILPCLNDKRGSLQFAMDTRYTPVKIDPVALEAKNANIIVSVNADFPDQIAVESMMVRKSLQATAFLELVTNEVVQNFAEFVNARDHAGEAIMHILKTHGELSRFVGVVSPEWIGNQFCEDVLDMRMPCMRRQLY